MWSCSSERNLLWSHLHRARGQKWLCVVCFLTCLWSQTWFEGALSWELQKVKCQWFQAIFELLFLCTVLASHSEFDRLKVTYEFDRLYCLPHLLNTFISLEEQSTHLCVYHMCVPHAKFGSDFLAKSVNAFIYLVWK